MARFLLKANFIVGSEVELSPEESHHLNKVLRMTEGQDCWLINGEGGLARATIAFSHGKKSRCLIQETFQERSSHRVHIAFSIPKSNALDFIIHRCTEVGVKSFQPLISDHSLKISSWNEERWTRVVLETSKQCQETFFPKVLAPVELKAWLDHKRDTNRALIYCDEKARQDALENVSRETEFDLLIGAEGGWSEEERILFQTKGRGMGLGKNRLRAETACVAALCLLKKHCNEM
ncbi:MAG: 16S rRNA (uracil(1498)-N(3))-methyltransferase [Proteobacteria bacterium]|nr:16S rRNA (uracil(1498)-N(3))-methyltransferase [Pseudomonadota bacterium]NBY19455.1 16S rRNA (uracil(1498)-N(3))-methyltransferase [bacterium]